jgi:hypothetical protein
MRISEIPSTLVTKVAATTGLLSASFPVYALVETFGAGFTVSESVVSRESSAIASCTVIGPIWDLGRNLWHRGFNVDPNNEAKVKYHDRRYNCVFSSIYAAGLYSFTTHDLGKTLGGAGLSALVGFCAGGFFGKGRDWFVESVGLKELKRLPTYVQNSSVGARRAFAGIMVATALTACAKTYELRGNHPDVSIAQYVSNIFASE